MACIVTIPALGDFIVHDARLAARLARELGGRIEPLVDTPPEPVAVDELAPVEMPKAA